MTYFELKWRKVKSFRVIETVQRAKLETNWPYVNSFGFSSRLFFFCDSVKSVRGPAHAFDMIFDNI